MPLPTLKSKSPKESFQSVLNESLHPSIKISKHAEKRMDERNISFTHRTWAEIEAKLSEAKTKGVSESLILTKNAALIASAKNETIITAMNRQEASSQLFTGIDGAIIIDH